MKALITGHSSGIGKAICEHLRGNGYEILTLKTRLENSIELEKEVNTLLKANEIDVLVNAAGFGVFEPHEEISVATIKKTH